MKNIQHLIEKTSQIDLDNKIILQLRSILQQNAKATSKSKNIVVVGEVKKGKSSLINTLLQRDISPTSSDIATSTVISIKHGPKERYFVKHLSEGEVFLKKEISKEDLSIFATEDGNPNNKFNVENIEIESPSSFLQSGFTLIDTPGLGGLYKKHANITWKYIPTADVIIFVLDSVESLITKEEVNYFERIIAFGVPIVFVQTKIDMVAEDKWKGWRDRNFSIIQKTLAQQGKKQLPLISYFTVSSKLYSIGKKKNNAKIIERSYFPNLLQYLTVSLPQKQQHKFVSLSQKIAVDMLSTYKKELHQSAMLISSSSKTELTNIQKDIEDKQKEFVHWKTTTFLNLKKQLGEDMRALKTETVRQLQDSFSTLPTSPLLSSLEDDIIKASSVKESQINEVVTDIVAKVEDQCLLYSHTIISDYQDGFRESLQQFDITVSDQIQEFDLNPPSLKNHTNIQVKNPSAVMHVMAAKGFGGLATAAVSTTAASTGLSSNVLLAGFFGSFGLPFAVGVVIGGAILSMKIKEQKQRTKETLERQIKGMVIQAINNQKIHIMRGFEDISIQMNTLLEEIQSNLIQEQSQKHTEQLKKITELQSKSREESQEQLNALKKKMALTDVLLQEWVKLGTPPTKN